MKHSSSIEAVVLLLGVMVILLAIYAGGYLLSVRRGVWPQDSEMVPGLKSRYFAVGPTFKGAFISRLFAPALAIDSGFIRKRYWHGWHVVVTTNGTNIYYDTDLISQQGR